MKIIKLLVFLIFTSPVAHSQNLVGNKYNEIARYMREKRKDLNFDKVTNSKFIYLKYSDNSDTQTLLFFMNADSVCKSIRLICDPALKTEKVNEFNSIYKVNGQNKWTDRREGRDFNIEMTDEKWSCIITIEPDK